MSTKHESKCLQNARDDEPIFVLRGQDRLAPATIRFWASAALDASREGEGNEATVEKAERAMRYADEIEQWQQQNVAKVPD